MNLFMELLIYFELLHVNSSFICKEFLFLSVYLFESFYCTLEKCITMQAT